MKVFCSPSTLESPTSDPCWVPNDQKYSGRAQGMYFFSHWTNRVEVDMKLGALLMGSKLIETDSTWRRQPRHLQFSIVIVCLGGRRACGAEGIP